MIKEAFGSEQIRETKNLLEINHFGLMKSGKVIFLVAHLDYFELIIL